MASRQVPTRSFMTLQRTHRPPIFNPSLIIRGARTQAPLNAAKQRTLAKPDRWRPPSHAARLPRKPVNYPGAPLTEAQRMARSKKKYPNMFPPEGTFMHWFLTNKAVHGIIATSVLISLAFIVTFEQWRQDLPPTWRALLPSKSLLPWHPWTFMGQFIEVVKGRTRERSLEVDLERRRNVDDAVKRAQYRRVHGIKSNEIASMLGIQTVEDGEIDEERRVAAEAAAAAAAAAAARAEEVPADDGKSYLDFEGKKRREYPVKRWFGIWS